MLAVVALSTGATTAVLKNRSPRPFTFCHVLH